MPKTVRLLAAAALALSLAGVSAPAFAAQPAAVTAGVAADTGIGWDHPLPAAIGWDTTPTGNPGIGWD
ncbi:hypothetical protein ACIF6L_08955 [Kitasatospora sp. NPDC086009]|uniref:hypothetical protein n=1 Tax=unclassified Kitasatospora TaxID=2633591 RepID=UPI002E36FA6D|nr:hypothetical protein [Kitasatospora sp. NBC_01246]